MRQENYYLVLQRVDELLDALDVGHPKRIWQAAWQLRYTLLTSEVNPYAKAG